MTKPTTSLRFAGYRLRVDPRVPPDEIWFEDKEILVGRLTGIQFPTLWERVWAWLTRPLWTRKPPRRRRADVEDRHTW
jgi:hypothetical protein